MPPANYTGPEPSDPEQSYRPVAELTHDELCVELTEARWTLEAIYPYQDRGVSARMREIRDELTRRDVAAPAPAVTVDQILGR